MFGSFQRLQGRTVLMRDPNDVEAGKFVKKFLNASTPGSVRIVAPKDFLKEKQDQIGAVVVYCSDPKFFEMNQALIHACVAQLRKNGVFMAYLDLIPERMIDELNAFGLFAGAEQTTVSVRKSSGSLRGRFVNVTFSCRKSTWDMGEATAIRTALPKPADKNIELHIRKSDSNTQPESEPNWLDNRAPELEAPVQDWASAMMVHGPLISSWSLLRNKNQAGLVCAHWRYGCLVAEHMERQTTRRPRVRYSAKTSEGHVKRAGNKTMAGRGCTVLTFSGIGGLVLVILVSGAICFTLAHILVLMGFIIFMSSYSAVQLSQAGILKRLARRHWIFDGSAHLVVMLAILILILLGSCAMPDGGMAAVFPVTHVFPMFLFMLGCFLNDAITKRDFHQFVATKIGSQKTLSEICIRRQDPPAACPVCENHHM